jgi:hypothetical protein
MMAQLAHVGAVLALSVDGILEGDVIRRVEIRPR